MKTFLMVALALASQSSMAAISINGVAVINARDFIGISNVPDGSLGLLILDVGGDGIVGVPSNVSGPVKFPVGGSLYSQDPGTAGIDVGSTFGGDLVLARMTATTSGTSGQFTISLSNLEVTGRESRQFAVVWFNELTSSDHGSASGGNNFGIVHRSNWVLPSTDTGLSYTFAGAAPTFPQANMAQTNLLSGFYSATNDGKSAANIHLIPESTTMILGLPSIAFLLRRKRSSPE